MTIFATSSPYTYFADLAGAPLNGGCLYFGQAGQNPETHPATVYWDVDGTQPAAQPIRTMNGFPVRSGAPAVIYAQDDYSLTARDSRGRLVLNAANSADFSASQALAAEIAALNAFLQDGVGAVTRTLLQKLRDIAVTPADFDAGGDDTIDDTTALQDALAATVATRALRLERGKTYKIASDELVMQDSSTLEVNGATLHFTHTDPNKRCLVVGNGCILDLGGGQVTNTSGVVGSDGTNQTPITVGVYTSNTEGKKGWTIRNGNIQTSTPGGNGIAFIGDCSNGLIENINFPTSANLGLGILGHWSSVGGVAGPTMHPHNVTIRNITSGTLSYNAGTWRGLVFLSACYNIKLVDIDPDLVTHGKTITVYAGDFGFQYGSTIQQVMGFTGITIENVHGQSLVGVHVYAVNAGGDVVQRWPGSVVMDNVCVYGITGDTGSRGLLIEGTDSVKVTNSILDSFYVGAQVDGVVTNFSLEDSEIRQSVTDALQGLGLAVGSGAITVRNTHFIGTNTSGTDGAGNHGDIRMVNCAGLTIDHNTFNSSNATWNVQVDNTCSRVRETDNHTYNVCSAGPAYSNGNASDKGIVIEWHGNTCDDSPSNGLRGGQIYMPLLMGSVSSHVSPQNRKPSHWMGPGVPSVGNGDWVVGDLIFVEIPTPSNPPAYSCTSGGDAGTWKAWASLPA